MPKLFLPKLLILGLCCLIPGKRPPAQAEDFRIGSLMRMLAAVPGSHTTFREEKRLAQLTRPVEDSGTLDYARPAHLEKHTTAPQEEKLVVDGDRLTISRAGAATADARAWMISPRYGHWWIRYAEPCPAIWRCCRAIIVWGLKEARRLGG